MKKQVKIEEKFKAFVTAASLHCNCINRTMYMSKFTS